jgi:hypothetical protein
MRTNKNHIEDNVDKTMKALDGIVRANPRPFLYTRIQAKLGNKASKNKNAGFLSPAFQPIAFALILIVIAVNVYTATRVFISPEASEEEPVTGQAFVEEYYPTIPTLYTISPPVSNP